MVDMHIFLIPLLISIFTMPIYSKKAATASTGSIMMDWMVDDMKTNTSIIHLGGQAQIIFKCSQRIKYCTRPPNQTEIRVSTEFAVNDRADVRATWNKDVIEMQITFTEDVPFGEFACICNGKRMVYNYLYRLCSIEEVIQYEASFKKSANQSCFAIYDPSTNKTTYDYKLTKAVCDKSHLYPASRKSRNYANHTICDGSSSLTLCHSIYKEYNDKTFNKTLRTNVVTNERNLCSQTYQGFPLYSIVHVSSMVNPKESCASILKSSVKQFAERISLEVPVRIMSERSKFCFVAPEGDKKNPIYIDLTVSPKVRKANAELWKRITHTDGIRGYDIDIVRNIDRVYESETIKIECRRSPDLNTVPFVRTVVRLIYMNLSIVPVIKTSQSETCGRLRNLNCQLHISETSKFRFGFEWTLNGTIPTEKVEGSRRAIDDIHLYRGPGKYKCHVRLPLAYPLHFNLKYGIPMVELVSAPFKVEYKCLSKQIMEQLRQFQLGVADSKRSEFTLHLAMALGAIVFCGALAGLCLLLATKTNVFDRLFGVKNKKPASVDTDIGTFDRGISRSFKSIKKGKSKFGSQKIASLVKKEKSKKSASIVSNLKASKVAKKNKA